MMRNGLKYLWPALPLVGVLFLLLVRPEARPRDLVEALAREGWEVCPVGDGALLRKPGSASWEELEEMGPSELGRVPGRLRVTRLRLPFETSPGLAAYPDHLIQI